MNNASIPTVKPCPKCGFRGRRVPEITLKSLVKIEVQKNFKSLSGFSFCPSRGCEVVYFRGEETIEKNGLRVKVGLKESSAKSRWLCYCFGYTLERIQNEIQKTGKTTVLEEITAKIKAKECSCKTKNPQGRCCLGEIKKALQEISYEF